MKPALAPIKTAKTECTTETVWYSSPTEGYWLRFILTDSGIKPQYDSKSVVPYSCDWNFIPESQWPACNSWVAYNLHEEQSSEFRLVPIEKSFSSWHLLRRHASIKLDKLVFAFSHFQESGWEEINSKNELFKLLTTQSDSCLDFKRQSSEITPLLNIPPEIVPTECFSSTLRGNPADQKKLCGVLRYDIPQKKITSPQTPQVTKTSLPQIPYIFKIDAGNLEDLNPIINLPAVIERTHFIVKRISQPSGLPRGQTIILRAVPDQYASLITKAMEAGHSPEDLRLVFEDYYYDSHYACTSKDVSLDETIKFLAAAISSKKAHSGLTLVFIMSLMLNYFKLLAPSFTSGNAPINSALIIAEDDFGGLFRDIHLPVNTENPTLLLLEKMIEDPQLPPGFRLKLPALGGHYYLNDHLGLRIIERLAENKKIISFHTPNADKDLTPTIKKVLETNDYLLEIISARFLGEKSLDDSEILFIYTSLLANRLKALTNILQPYFPLALSTIVAKYILNDIDDFKNFIADESIPKEKLSEIVEQVRLRTIIPQLPQPISTLSQQTIYGKAKKPNLIENPAIPGIIKTSPTMGARS